MFNFLNPAVLAAAAAALIPLLIHLFSKRRVKVVEFSSLKHLKEMQKRQVRRLRIRQLLLLLLRMLIILLIVLAFARPTTEGGAVGSHASVSAVVLLDNSASMNRYVRDGNLFDLAKRQTVQLLETFGESDEVQLVTLSRRSGGGAGSRFSSAAVALEELERIEAGYGAADMQAALGQASRLIENASNLNKEVYFITDAQRVSLPDSGLTVGDDVQVYLLELPREDAENVGVTSVDFGGQLLIPGHDFDVVARVRNYGSESRDDLIASLYLDGRRVAQTDVTVGGDGEEAVRFTHSVNRGGFHSGWIELSDDKFPADNRFYFTFRIPEQFNVLLIGDDPATRFVSLALTPSGSLTQYWSVKEARPDELGSVQLRDYDVIVMVGVPSIAESYTERIKAAVRRGTSLFMTYGAETDTSYFNRQWAEVAGVRIEEPARRDFSRAGFYTLEAATMNHPIFSVFHFENGALPEVKFYTLPRVSAIPEAGVLAQFSGKRPALVEAGYGEGRIVTFTGPLGPEFSDMTGHAFFVPFVSRTAEYLAADLSAYDFDLYAGEKITRSISIAGSLSGSVEMIAPDSSRYFLAPEEDKGQLLLRANPTDEPGVYSVRYAGQEVDRFAVNVDPEECNLAAVDDDRFAAAVGAPEYEFLPMEVELASVISEFRYGKELWQLFLWIAAMLLLAEMLLARGATTEE